MSITVRVPGHARAVVHQCPHRLRPPGKVLSTSHGHLRASGRAHLGHTCRGALVLFLVPSWGRLPGPAHILKARAPLPKDSPPGLAGQHALRWPWEGLRQAVSSTRRLQATATTCPMCCHLSAKVMLPPVSTDFTPDTLQRSSRNLGRRLFRITTVTEGH